MKSPDARMCPLPYAAPEVTSYGTLTEMTASVLGGARVATGSSLASLSAPMGGGGAPVPETPGNTGSGAPVPGAPGNTGSGAPAPGTPGSGTAGVQAESPSGSASGTTGATGPTGNGSGPGQIEVAGERATSGSNPAGSGTSGGDGGGSGGVTEVAGTAAAGGSTGSLPYTGFSAAFVAAIGAGMVGAGTAIRRKLRNSW